MLEVNCRRELTPCQLARKLALAFAVNKATFFLKPAL
jgi:hypothetical protein